MTFRYQGGSPGRTDQRAGAAVVPARPRLPRPHRRGLAAQRRAQRRPARGADLPRRARHRHRACYCAATAGWSDDASPTPTSLDRPAFAPDATVAVADVSVWFGPKVALSELSCSFGPGVTGLLGPNGAGKTTLMRAITGLVGVNQGTVRIDGRDPRRDRQVYAGMALVPEDEAVPAGLTAAPVRALRRRPAPRRRSQCAGRRAADRWACSTPPTGSRHVQQGHAPAHQDRGRAREQPRRPGARRAA